MKWIICAIVVVVLVVLGAMTWIRLAPDDVARWHRLPDEVLNTDLEGGVMRHVPGDLAAFDAVARAAPRTHVLAGSVEEGMITYVSRSRVFGFPDYTTVAQRGDDLAIHARLRYGRSDMGVNKARVERWLAESDQ